MPAGLHKSNSTPAKPSHTQSPIYHQHTAHNPSKKSNQIRRTYQIIPIFSFLSDPKIVIRHLSRLVWHKYNTYPTFQYLLDAQYIIFLQHIKIKAISTPLCREDNGNIGNIRETIFFNQMRLNYTVSASPISDFCINDYTFEVEGKKKGQQQIEKINNAYIVKDDIETAFLNVIPLWWFGLNY